MTTLRRFTLAVLFLAVVGGFTVARAEDSFPLAFDFSLDAASKYIWRGIPVNSEAVLQPGFGISGYGLSLSYWGNYDLTATADKNDFSEHDWTAAYGIDIPETPLAVEVGAIYYYFPSVNGDNDTTEVYASISADVLLAPTLSVYYDVDVVEGSYVSLGIGHSFPLEMIDENLSLDLAMSVGWGSKDYNNAYHGVNNSAFNDLTTSVGLTYTVNESFTIGASAVSTTMLDSDIEKAWDNTAGVSASNLYGMFSMALSF